MEQLPDYYPLPDVRHCRLADFTSDLAASLERQDHWDEATTHIEKALRFLTEATFRYQEIKSHAALTLGKLLELATRGWDKRGKPAEARRTIDAMRALFGSRNEPESRLQIAALILNQGRVEEAVADAESVAASSPTEAVALYNAACILALASGRSPGAAGEAARYADRAMALLTRAVKASFKDAAHMKQDPDLVALCDRDDFKKLLAELTPSKKPDQKPSRARRACDGLQRDRPGIEATDLGMASR